MCKHCKNEKRIKQLEAELAALRVKVDSHVGHYIYPYPYSTTYGSLTPNNITWTSGTTFYDNGGNGGVSSES